MSYRNAQNILPEELIELIQQYVDGVYLYIPRKEAGRKKWGENTNIKNELEERNALIYADYLQGISVMGLSRKYFLSEKSIQRIVYLRRKKEREEKITAGEHMEREIDLKQISDGRLYSANDMVKAGCNDCAGCSVCCQGMGNSIILDPYDIYSLEKGLSVTFEELMKDRIELNVVDGIILPNLKMQDNDSCGFLNEKGRCSIHEFRPGFCRMFPLGRIYEEGTFKYFLQIHECPHQGKTKVKLKKWLGVPHLESYEAYIKEWHYFLKDVQEIIRNAESDEIIKRLNMYLLEQFFVRAYETASDKTGEEDFYTQFGERLKEAGEKMAFYR